APASRPWLAACAGPGTACTGPACRGRTAGTIEEGMGRAQEIGVPWHGDRAAPGRPKRCCRDGIAQRDPGPETGADTAGGAGAAVVFQFPRPGIRLRLRATGR